ncbi:hypothetical protein [Micromonospora sp. NBS 11-29]|uniref:hypothetical protein n=1 Tax=Micromonospora sp. NBS 11-29 TaxID=1960879 RepID=UPI000B787805|nr:hypothetical protein [Micromonospora sp. NBS 11-29]
MGPGGSAGYGGRGGRGGDGSNGRAHKYAELGLAFPLADTAPPTPELLARVRGQFAERGLTVT